MTTRARRLDRLKRLEAVRDIARQAAAREAAEAESTLARLQALATRTAGMAQGYGRERLAGRDGRAVEAGGDLIQIGRFVSGLGAIARTARGDARRAETIADTRLHALAEAERRRSAVSERIAEETRALARDAARPALECRRPDRSGTELE